VSEFHTEAPQATASEGLAHGPYVAGRAGFEPVTLQTKGVKSTNEHPCPQNINNVVEVTGRKLMQHVRLESEKLRLNNLLLLSGSRYMLDYDSRI